MLPSAATTAHLAHPYGQQCQCYLAVFDLSELCCVHVSSVCSGVQPNPFRLSITSCLQLRACLTYVAATSEVSMWVHVHVHEHTLQCPDVYVHEHTCKVLEARVACAWRTAAIFDPGGIHASWGFILPMENHALLCWVAVACFVVVLCCSLRSNACLAVPAFRPAWTLWWHR